MWAASPVSITLEEIVLGPTVGIRHPGNEHKYPARLARTSFVFGEKL
jgi:hypothetical protein